MSTLIYPSAISEELYAPAPASTPSAQSQDDVPPQATRTPSTATTGGFAPFICHVAQLEAHLLRGDKSKFFERRFEVAPGSRQSIGNGASFIVERAELQHRKGNADAADIPPSMRFVAIKTVRERPTYEQNCESRAIHADKT